jgi:hypothetical protein
MPHAPAPTDVEQLRHVAQDADGEPLTSDELAFLASGQDVLRIMEDGELFVVGIAQVRRYPVCRVRDAVVDARVVWRLVASGMAGPAEDTTRCADDSV